MSKTKTIVRLLCLGLALSVGLFLVQVASAAGDAAKVSRLKGDVKVKYGKAAFKSIKKGAMIKAGAVVKTGRKSRIEIKLADNSVIRLGSNSKVTLQRAMFADGGNKKVTARLWGGKAYAVVNKLVGKESSFEIKTGTAVAGVRGTAFRINAARDQSTVVRVYSGAVAVSNAPIFAKSGKRKTPGKAPIPPRRGIRPGGPGVAEVAGPQEVSKGEWEEIVATAMQEIRVSSTGKLSSAVAFDPVKEEQEDDWVAWNKAMDKELPQ